MITAHECAYINLFFFLSWSIYEYGLFDVTILKHTVIYSITNAVLTVFLEIVLACMMIADALIM